MILQHLINGKVNWEKTMLGVNWCILRKITEIMTGPKESATIAEGEPFLCVGVDRLLYKQHKEQILFRTLKYATQVNRYHCPTRSNH